MIFTDSQAALIAIRERFSNPLGQTFARQMGNGAADAGRLGIPIRFARIPYHVGIIGNETAGDVARAIAALPMTASGEYFVGHDRDICQLDSAEWAQLRWPYGRTNGSRNKYSRHIRVK